MLCYLIFSFHLESGGLLPERENKTSDVLTSVKQLLTQLQYPNYNLYYLDVYDTRFFLHYIYLEFVTYIIHGSH